MVATVELHINPEEPLMAEKKDHKTESELPKDHEEETAKQNLEDPLSERRTNDLHPRQEDLAKVEPGQTAAADKVEDE